MGSGAVASAERELQPRDNFYRGFLWPHFSRDSLGETAEEKWPQENVEMH